MTISHLARWETLSFGSTTRTPMPGYGRPHERNLSRLKSCRSRVENVATAELSIEP